LLGLFRLRLEIAKQRVRHYVDVKTRQTRLDLEIVNLIFVENGHEMPRTGYPVLEAWFHL
jgi:hypothetical protein